MQIPCLRDLQTPAQNFLITSFFAERVRRGGTKTGQPQSCPDESVRNNACHHGCVNRRVRLGGKRRHPRHRAMMTPPQICISEDSSEPKAHLRHQD